MQLQQNCLTDGKNQAVFQYFKETAAVISLVAENGSNILSMQYDKIQQVSEDTVLSSYLAPQKEIKAPRMPEAIIYPFGLNPVSYTHLDVYKRQGIYLSGYGTLRQARRQQTDEYNLAAGSSDPGEVFEEDK